MARAEAQLEPLVHVASAAAEARGHRLGRWTSSPGEEDIARSAVCARCGEVAYVRQEGDLTGMSGGALTEPCSRGAGAGPRAGS